MTIDGPDKILPGLQIAKNIPYAGRAEQSTPAVCVSFFYRSDLPSKNFPSKNRRLSKVIQDVKRRNRGRARNQFRRLIHVARRPLLCVYIASGRAFRAFDRALVTLGNAQLLSAIGHVTKTLLSTSALLSP